MSARALLLAAALCLVPAAEAAAATRYVDDDAQNCPSAPYSTIQAAIDAAVPGDTVRVCDGVYPEQIVVPASKPGLRIRSDDGGAVVQSPPGGLEPMADPGFGLGQSLALLTVDAERTVVSRMAFTGSVTAADQAAACTAADTGELRVAGVAMRAGRGVLEHNDVGPLSFDCSSTGFSQAFAGVAVFPPQGIVLDGNSVAFTPVGIDALGARATLLRNDVQLTDTGIRVHESAFPTIRSNDLVDNGRAVSVLFSRVLAVGNRVRGNTVGFEFDDGAGGIVRNNFVEDGFNGIIVDFIGPNGIETDMTIRGNRVRDNANIGIGVLGGPRGGGNVLTRNSSLGNGVYDCLDETSGEGTSGTADVWTGNVGVIDSPNVCSAP